LLKLRLMRILFLTHSFNSLAQRLFCELTARGHEVSIEFDIADSVAEEAVELFNPDIILAPFLKRAIPESIWSKRVCLVVHPGIVGDRGPSALDWAIQEGETAWGVTVLQAEAEMDAGPVWATAEFPMAPAKKSSLYRQQVTEAGVRAVLMAVERVDLGVFQPTPLRDFLDARGRLRPPMKQADRAIDWRRDDSGIIRRKLNAADGFPGVADNLFNEPCHLFDAWPEDRLRGRPGEIIGRRETALLRATTDGAVWIGHVRRHGGKGGGIKLPATVAFAEKLDAVPELPLSGWWPADHATWQDIRYEEGEGIGFLHFDFYNGAMGTRQCQRLREAFLWAATRPTQAIVLMGGSDFWSNGLHLNLIEQAAQLGDSPADESMRNIEAMDDLAETVLRATSRLVIAALQGNTGAGGCFLARTADLVWLRDGVILNPHYKNMGNLYGSEFWTYLLPPRVGEEGARAIMNRRLPMTARESVASGFYDACLASDPAAFRADVVRRAAELAASGDLVARLRAKRDKRERDEAAKPLSAWRAEEMAHMERNFYGFDPSYHVARWHFVTKSPQSWTPRHLAKHREPGFASDGEGVTSGKTTKPRGTL
jgi:putative two-component system hydrogenase maturation factor HypX/HoxX